ncbi:MAG TPA: Mur ligase family protein [bacterium]|nr:Mur ligase family protein [bacterium]
MLSGKTVLFVRICGTGVSSAAQFAQRMGARVLGTDSAYYPPISDSLKRAGIAENPLADTIAIIGREKPDLIVVGNALWGKSPEAAYILSCGIPYYSMPSFLEEFLIPGHRSVVVAGTHGKTTTTTLIAEFLAAVGKKPSYMIGGIPLFSMTNAAFEKDGYFVIEGDEYDTAFFDKGPKFLHYRPDIGIVTSIEYDHADIYASLEAIFESFRKFTGIITKKCILNIDFANNKRLLALFPRELFFTYSITDPSADLFARRTGSEGRLMKFRVTVNGKEGDEFKSPLFGDQNLMNLAALMAFVHNELPQLDHAAVAAAIAGMKGVKRRQEFLGHLNGAPVYSDFAHHPTAVRYTFDSFRSLFGAKRYIVVFDPATNSNARDIFEKDYATIFADADLFIIGKPAKADSLKPEEKFNPERLCAAINRVKGYPAARHITEADQIIEVLRAEADKESVVIAMSNGGFGGFFGKLAPYLT